MNKNKRGISIVVIVLIILIILVTVGLGITISNKNKENVLQKSDTSISQDKNKFEEKENFRNESNDFLMTVEDVFSIEEKGTVITGRVESGEVRVGDSIEIVGMGKEAISTKVLSIEKFREDKTTAKEGESIGIILENVSGEDVERGHVLVEPNTIQAHTEFEAEIVTLTEKEGGRKNLFFEGYRPQFYFRTIAIAGIVSLIDVEQVAPGDDAKIKVVLTKSVAMEIGTEFSIREGGRTMGSGKVTKVY